MRWPLRGGRERVDGSAATVHPSETSTPLGMNTGELTLPCSEARVKCIVVEGLIITDTEAPADTETERCPITSAIRFGSAMAPGRELLRTWRVAVEEARRRGGEEARRRGGEEARDCRASEGQSSHTFRALAFVVTRLAHVPQ